MIKISATLVLVLAIALCSDLYAVTISKCILPDGSIEFTNQGCSNSKRLHSRHSFNRDKSRTEVKIISSKTRKQKPFRQAAFVQLQDKLLKAKNSQEMEKYAQTIIQKVNSSAQQGKLTSAYNMIAATYVKLSKFLKKKRWQGQAVAEHTSRIRTLFENILITQSTTSSSSELSQVIQSAWQNYQANS